MSFIDVVNAWIQTCRTPTLWPDHTNYKVNPYYDSLVLKIISKGKDRNEAMLIMKRALDEIIIDGINTNIELHKWILKQNEF